MGVDQGALDFVLDNNFKCGGFCSKGRVNKKGTIPKKYPLVEIESEEYFDRTQKNVVESDEALIISYSIEIKKGMLDAIKSCK